MHILLGIEGGAGKNIAATGAVKLASENGMKVDVITAWPQMWEGNPHVNKVYDWNRVEYFSELIKKYDRIVLDDAYRNSSFLLEGLDLSATYNLIINGIAEHVKPELYITQAEHLYVQSLLGNIEKPIMVVQTNGGVSEGYAWPRDLKLEDAVEILNEFNEEYEIVHLRGKGQLEIGGIKHTGDLTLRQCIAVLAMSEKRLLIDSIFQHAAAALELPSVVTWILTKPEQFGYELHTNILPNEPDLKNVDRIDVLIKGLDADPARCPYSKDKKIIDTQKIIKALKQ